MSEKSSEPAKDDDAMNTLFDILGKNLYFITLIQEFLNVKENVYFSEVLKGGLFKKIVNSENKTKDEKKSIAEVQLLEKTLDTFLANCKQLYDLIEKYKIEFPHGEPIVCACEKGRMDDVELFMNLHPFHKYITNRDVFGYRVSYRDKMTLKDMVSQLGKNSGGIERTPLMAAARNEHFQIVKYLIEQGADPNIANSSGYNALHFAAEYNRTNTELIKLLLAHMSLDSINKKDGGEFTPLDWAYRYNRSPLRQEIIALIRLAGGKANYYDDDGNYIDSSSDEEDADVNMDEQVNELLKF